MTKQQGQPDLNEILDNADRYLRMVETLFKGVRARVNEGSDTNVDSTWSAVTDDVKSTDDTPSVTDEGPQGKPTANDIYVELLERRAYEHARRGEMNAAAAIRRIINELRELDNFLS